MLELLFGFRREVDRVTYLAIGLLLAPLKYAVETSVVYWVMHVRWSPRDFFNPMHSRRRMRMAEARRCRCRRIAGHAWNGNSTDPTTR